MERFFGLRAERPAAALQRMGRLAGIDPGGRDLLFGQGARGRRSDKRGRAGLRGESSPFRRLNTMRALVTGGAGFLGSHIADALLARGYAVRVFDNLEERVHPRGKPAYISREMEFARGDIRDKHALELALEGVDVVCHAAAYQDYMCDYSKFFDSNVTGTALIFEIIRERKLPVRRFILSSSQAVYGEGQYRCDEHGFQKPLARTNEQLDRSQWNLICDQCGRELRP